MAETMVEYLSGPFRRATFGRREEWGRTECRIPNRYLASLLAGIQVQDDLDRAWYKAEGSSREKINELLVSNADSILRDVKGVLRHCGIEEI